MSTPPPIPQKKGMSGLAIVGIGCLGLIVIAFLGGGFLVAKFMPKLKEMAGEFEKDPAKAATLMALKMNPDVEILNTDDTKREVTFKVKSSGETTTISFDDFEKGKITLKNDKGEEYGIDASKAQTEGVVIKGPDGQTITSGVASAAAPPAEVPLYPGLKLLDGGFRMDQANTLSGMAVGQVTESDITKIKDHYETVLKAAGYEVTTVMHGDNASATVSAKMTEGQNTMSVMINRDSDTPDKVMINTQYHVVKP